MWSGIKQLFYSPMPRYSFVARMPNRPGSLQTAAAIVTGEKGNINRLQFDQKIDPATVFFDITCDEPAYLRIEQALARCGFLQDTLRPLNILKLHVFLPHETGALYRFLEHTTASGANICCIDFDDRGLHPDRLVVTLSLEESYSADGLLDLLKSRYRMEVAEFDTTGKHLDDTVFYVRFAQQVREIVGEVDDRFLFTLLADTNHAAQELMNLGKDPKTVFESILKTGRVLRDTTGGGFFADVQVIPVAEDLRVVAVQPPAGGSVYLLKTPDGCTQVDTGYGCYSKDIGIVIDRLFPEAGDEIDRVVITHADADHCGGGGVFGCPVMMHPGTLGIIRAANRAYGSGSEDSVLEEIYTAMINLFSGFNPPVAPDLFPTGSCGEISGLPVIAKLGIGGYSFSVLEGLGGHLFGQVYLFCRELGLLFSGDTLFNFRGLSPDRAAFNSLAVILMTSVNVDSKIAAVERQHLLEIAQDSSGNYPGGRTGCLICGGHGSVSVLEGLDLVTWGAVRQVGRRT